MNELEVLTEIEDIPHTEHVQDRVQLYFVQSSGHLFSTMGMPQSCDAAPMHDDFLCYRVYCVCVCPYPRTVKIGNSSEMEHLDFSQVHTEHISLVCPPKEECTGMAPEEKRLD